MKRLCYKRNFHRAPCHWALRSLSVASLVAALWCTNAAAHADEFSIVPAGDTLYQHLDTVTHAQWRTGATSLSSPAATSSQDVLPLTRYEMALETAKAIYALHAQNSSAGHHIDASRPELRALRSLALALAPELKRLEVDVRGTLDTLDAALRLPLGDNAKVETPASTLDAPAPRSATSATIDTTFNAPASLSLSQRLRFSAAMTALARESDDPFGDTLPNASALVGSTAAHQPTMGRTFIGADLSLSPSVRLRAGLENRTLRGLAAPDGAVALDALGWRLATPGVREWREIGGGLDIAVRSGLTLSGNVSRISGRGFVNRGDQNVQGLRFGGGVGVSAWQNRLSLRANLSRLVPEERSLLMAETAAAFNLDVGMSDRLRLKLLYQQWFTPQNTDGRSLVAGGLNLSF